MEGAPGQTTRCKECGYEAHVPDVAAAPDSKGLEKVKMEQVEPKALLGPFGLMAAFAGLATFYLSPFIFPFLLSAAAVVVGIVGLRQGRDRQILVSLVAGGLGLVLELVALAL